MFIHVIFCTWKKSLSDCLFSKLKCHTVFWKINFDLLMISGRDWPESLLEFLWEIVWEATFDLANVWMATLKLLDKGIPSVTQMYLFGLVYLMSRIYDWDLCLLKHLHWRFERLLSIYEGSKATIIPSVQVSWISRQMISWVFNEFWINTRFRW